MIINISDVWEKASSQHYAFLNTKIDKVLKSFSSSFIDMAINDFIKKNRHIIVEGTPSELADCIKDYKDRFGDGLLHSCVSQRLSEIFDFENFSIKSKREWTAFHLCNLAKYKVCCYCHMVSTDTNLPGKEVKGYRPPIDHYYIKSDYPFLALTLSNFIPCCEKCNGSQMKHSIDFSKIPHLNPLVDVESIEFELRPSGVSDDKMADALALNLDSSDYLLFIEAKCNLDKANRSINTFQLKGRYNNYASQAFYLARKIRGFATRKKMYENEINIKIELEDILEFKISEYKNTEYGKVRLCIAKQYEAIS